MKEASSMPGIGLFPEAADLCDIRCQQMRERFLAALILYAVICSSDAAASDGPFVALPADLNPAIPDSRLTTLLAPASEAWSPKLIDGTLPGAPQTASPGDFQIKKHSIFANDAPAARSESYDTLALHSTTVWQRLKDFRANGRVRLLTLWETQGSTISLQASTHGDPSLQWSSRSMNRGGATRGVFDQWASFAGRGANFWSISRSPPGPGVGAFGGGIASPSVLAGPGVPAPSAAKPASAAPIAIAK
jgi:hypothetical protein